METKPKTIFFGTSDFVIPVLKALTDAGYNPTVITQPDKHVGRKKVLTPPVIKTAALRLGLNVLQPSSLKDEVFYEEYKKIAPELCIVASYGKIIPENYLKIPRYGCLNIHPSKLPKYRGPTPVQSAIMDGDHETGISIILMDKEMDHGPIVDSDRFEISKSKYYPEIIKNIWEASANFLMKVLLGWIGGQIVPTPQDDTIATYCKLLTREDGKINWSDPAEKIYNRIRALSHEPGTWTTWQGRILNIKSAEFSTYEVENLGAEITPGTIVNVDNEIAVATSKCYLILKAIQLEGKKDVRAKDFAHGHANFVDSKLD